MSPDVVSGDGGGWWAIGIACTSLGDFCWEVQMK